MRRLAPQHRRSPARGFVLAAMGFIIALAASGAARATVIVNAVETGGDVVFTGSGTIDLTALTFSGGGSNSPQIAPIFARLFLGASANIDLYNGATGPSSFGPGFGAFASSASGDFFGMVTPSQLFVPQGYVSGSFLSQSTTFAGQTFASLGMTPGSYTWAWGSGGSADSYTLNIVPEPSAALLLGCGLAGLALRRRRGA